jgi:hypothetical protein
LKLAPQRNLAALFQPPTVESHAKIGHSAKANVSPPLVQRAQQISMEAVRLIWDAKVALRS